MKELIKKINFKGFEYEEKVVKDKRNIDLNCYRKIGALIYLFLAILLLVILIILTWKTNISCFYDVPMNNIWNWPRFIWTLIFTMFGMAGVAHTASKKTHDDKISDNILGVYFTRYLFIILGITSLIFGILSSFPCTSSYTFYFISGPLGLLFGYTTDIFAEDPWSLAKKLLTRQ